MLKKLEARIDWKTRETLSEKFQIKAAHGWNETIRVVAEKQGYIPTWTA